MKYLKSLFIVISTTLVMLLLSSSLCYFNIINDVFNDVLKLVSILISCFLGGLYIGFKSATKGYLEGIKIGGGIVIFMLLLSYLGFDDGFRVIKIVYYLMILILTIGGSIIGINKSDQKK